MKKVVDHIAIIGCGFSGTSAFYQVVTGYPVKEITIFEASGEFGPGFAYQPTECADYLINNTTDTMCLGPDNRRAFLDWLEAHPNLSVDLSPKGHLPRSIYGLFLRDVVASMKHKAEAQGINCRLIPAVVTRVKEELSGKVIIEWEGGITAADAAIMTTGRCPEIEFVSAPPSQHSAQYFNSHIGSEALDELSLRADIHILGTSLSAYDIINRLYSEETGCRFERRKNGQLTFVAGPNQRKTTLYSRSGRLKKMQSRVPQPIRREAFNLPALREKHAQGHVLLTDIARAIIADSYSHEASLDQNAIEKPYQGCNSTDEVNRRAGEILAHDLVAAKNGNGENFLVDIFDDAQIDLWDGFAEHLISASDEIVYRKEFETALLAYAAPCPIPTAERVLALHHAGRLRVIHGVGTPTLSNDGKHFDIPHAHGVSHADTLINATGKVDRNIQSDLQPAWVKAMAAAGDLNPYKRDGKIMAGADIDMSTFRPPTLKSIYVANMLLWGPGFFTSSAFVMATIVSRLLRTLFDTSDAYSAKDAGDL